MDKVIYIIGTSQDILTLDRDFFKDKISIGINSAYKVARGLLTYWMAADRYFKFHEFVAHNEAPLTKKFVWVDYAADDRLNVFRGTGHTDPIHRAQVKDWLIYFYSCKTPTPQTLSPTVTFDKEKLSVLDNYVYTLPICIGLAVGLGATEIRLRGVSFGNGGHFDDDDPKSCHEAWDNNYEPQVLIFKKDILPALQKLNIPIINETLDPRYYFTKDWKLTINKP